MIGYTGIRIHRIKVQSKLNGISRELKVAPIWAESILGMRNELDLNNWEFIVQADIGSFYINEKLSFMINVNSYYRIKSLISVKLGWRDWNINFKNQYRNENLVLKVQLSGPSAAFVFHF